MDWIEIAARHSNVVQRMNGEQRHRRVTFRSTKKTPLLLFDSGHVYICSSVLTALLLRRPRLPPRCASTFSPYRIGILVSFHRPACITDAISILSAKTNPARRHQLR